ncbi:hypothetical protein EN792_071655, partial [Mesorhizobium sp. M00.F.Ca.ET.149.01.1.1]
ESQGRFFRQPRARWATRRWAPPPVGTWQVAVRLDQTYRRLDESRYPYAAPMFGYEAVLDVSVIGLVLDYPGLWTSVARPG